MPLLALPKRRGAHKPVDDFVACRAGNTEYAARGWNLVLLLRLDPVILPRLLAREELLVFSRGTLIEYVKIAVEIGAKAEAHAVRPLQHQPRIDGSPRCAIEAVEHDFHAVPIGSRAGLSPECTSQPYEGRETPFHRCTSSKS